MITIILAFRSKQVGRMLREIGAVYFAGLVLVCFGFFMGLIEAVVRSKSMWMGLIGVLIAASIHFSRKDSGFLKMLEVNSKRRSRKAWGRYWMN